MCIAHNSLTLGSRFAGELVDVIELISVIAVAGAIVYWYVQSEQSGDNGESGFFGLIAAVKAVATAQAGPRKQRYRMKSDSRAYSAKGDKGTIAESATQHAAYKASGKSDAMQRKFEKQDATRYRIKDRAARYKKKAAAN